MRLRARTSLRLLPPADKPKARKTEYPTTGLLYTRSAEIVPPEPTGDELPTEFLIFRGPVATSLNGDVLYDAEAAEAVKASWMAHWGRLDGHDLMIDLDHAAIHQTSADAMGWARLDFRGTPEAPELWAAEVRWTAEGAQRLRERRQRYQSPTFRVAPPSDEKSLPRVTKLINVALTALPASDGLDALIAASQFAGSQKPLVRSGSTMEPETSVDQTKLAEALGLAPEASQEDILAALQALASQMSEELGVAPAEPAAPAEGEIAAASKEDSEEVAEAKAAKLLVLSLTGAKNVLPAVSIIETWKAAFLDQEASKAKLQAERAKLESAERRSIGAALVQGGMPPALVWSDDTARELAPALANQPIEQLRAYAAKAAGQPKGRTAPTVPTQSNSLGLTESQLRICRETGTDPAAFAAARNARKVG